MNFYAHIIFDLIKKDKQRLDNTYNLIASENLCSQDILTALGSFINYKYTEGYPGKRYYNGNENYDKIEVHAVELAKQLFNCKVANVQPLSGAIMNIALISNILKPGDTILSIDLSSGGHLTHGSPANFVGKTYNLVFYKLDKNGRIDYKDLEFKAKKNKPKLIISGTTAYSREIDFKKIGKIAKEVGALHLADISHIAGLVATGYHQSPIKYADFVTTTTHKTLRGPRGGLILSNNLEYEKLINTSIFPHFQGGSHPNIIAAKAICFSEALTPIFKKYIKDVLVNTKYLCNELKRRGFKIVSDGTDNHLFVIDFNDEKFDGRQFADLIEKEEIIVNANSVPGDKGTPFRPKGVRVGLALETTRNITKHQLKYLATKFKETYDKLKNEKK